MYAWILHVAAPPCRPGHLGRIEGPAYSDATFQSEHSGDEVHHEDSA